MGYCVPSYCGPDGGAGSADIAAGKVADSAIGRTDVGKTV